MHSPESASKSIRLLIYAIEFAMSITSSQCGDERPNDTLQWLSGSGKICINMKTLLAYGRKIDNLVSSVRLPSL
jgi:hypothetical protein